MKQKVLSLALALSLCVGLLAVPAMAAGTQYDDTTGHWAEASIERWSEYNIVEGDNGHFHPDQSLTRGQMAKILANTLGLTDQGTENPFADVPADAWYTPYVLRCYAAGIMVGDGQRANPEVPITRQETMTVLARALNIAPVKDADLSAYADGDTVADWAAPYVAAMTQAGIVNGVGENRLTPVDEMTRASVMAVLDRTVVQYINAPGSYDLTDKKGLVLVAAGDVTLTGKTSADILVTAAATGKEVTFDKAQVTGSVTVQADNAKVVSKNNSSLPEIVALGQGVKTETEKPKRTSSGGGGGGGSSTPTYSNLTIAEAKSVTEAATYQNVTITDAVGDGTVTLANMTILGNLYINGGGANTVNLTNVTIKGKIIMAKVGGERPRLNLTNTPVSTVEVNQPATIEADAASAVTAVQAKANVYVVGADTVVTTVTVPAGVTEKVNVSVTAGSVSKVEAKSETAVTGADNSVAQVVAEAPVTVAADAVAKVEVPATAGEGVSVAVTGSGSVDVAVNSENGAAITTGDGGASVIVSSDLATLPNVTVDGEAVTHIHKWDEGEVTTAPTCTDDGVKTYTCTAEGCTDPAATKTEAIPALGHTEVIDQAVAATCTEAGKTEGKHCSVCNAVLTAQETVPALGHDFTGAWLTDADGHWHKCTRCDVTDEKAAHTYPADASCDAAANCTVCAYEKAAGTHTWGQWTKKDEADHAHTCTACSATETAAHQWDDGVITTEPTEDKEGVKTFTCSVCKGTKTETVPMASKSAITLVQAGDKIKATWSGFEYSKYCLIIANDTDDVKYFNTTSNDFTISEGNFPTPETTTTYSLVLRICNEDMSLGAEIARLNDCIQVAVSGDAVEYEMKFNSTEAGKHTATLASPVDATFVWAWYRENAEISSGVNSGSVKEVVSTLELQDNDVFDIRLITAYELDGQILKATVTPPSIKTYTAPEDTKIKDLEAALNNGGTVSLAEDISGDSIEITGTTPATLDLAGHTITMSGSLFTQAGTTLTIKDTTGTGSIVTTANYGVFNSGGTITLEGGTIKAAQAPLYQASGTMTITGGSAIREGECQYIKQAFMVNGGTVNISGGTLDGMEDGTAMYIASAAEVSITGGTFRGVSGDIVIRKNADTGTLSITGGTFAADVSEYVPDTHACTQSGESWTVSAK